MSEIILQIVHYKHPSEFTDRHPASALTGCAHFQIYLQIK